MPNYAKREQELLSPDQLALAEQSRHPALGALDDAALLTLIEALQAARAEATTADGDPAPAEMLRTAQRRADMERRKRRLPVTGSRAASTGQTKPAAKPTAAKTAATKRKQATVPRTPSDRKPAELRKTNLRTEPHRVPKRRTKTVPDPASESVEAQTEAARTTAGDDKTQQAARKVQKDAAKAVEKEAAKTARRAERQATKQAQKDAAKAAKAAEKEAAKIARRAARKAERQAETPEAKAARKSAKASKDGTAPKAKADGKQAKAKSTKKSKSKKSK